MPATYTDTQKAHAVELYTEHGLAETSRRLGIPGRTIGGWVKAAGAVTQASQEKTAVARAANAERVQRAWADFRENEALAAGAAANQIRGRIRTLVDAGAPGREVRDLTVAYGIFIDKAELLSGQATARIEVWAESELDRELRSLITDMEETIREHRSGA